MCLAMLGCCDGGLSVACLLAAGVAVLATVAGLSCIAAIAGRRVARRGVAAKRISAQGADPDICDHGPAGSHAAMCGVLPVEVGPDIHLVMNTFNRIAGETQFDGSAAADPVFALSDYLRQCLVHTAPAQVALHEEVEMLQSYLRLAAIFHGRDLRASVEVAPGSGDVRVQAHSICLVAQLLLAGLSDASKGPYVLPVRVQGLRTGGIDMEMALRLDSRSPNTHLRHLRHLRAELRRLAALMSQRSVRWSCRVVRDHGSDIAVSLRIRPRPRPAH